MMVIMLNAHEGTRHEDGRCLKPVRESFLSGQGLRILSGHVGVTSPLDLHPTPGSNKDSHANFPVYF